VALPRRAALQASLEKVSRPDESGRAMTPSGSALLGPSSSPVITRPLLFLSLRGVLLPKDDEAISVTIAVVSKQYYVYIMTNKQNTVVYVGVTSDLIRRVYEHKEKLANGFTKKYNIAKLVYYEVFEDVENAILREKQIKAGSRQKKVQLINSMNKEWCDLYDEL
jgi:putative endonuclease